MTQNASKRPHHRYHNAAYQSLLHNGKVHDSAGELNLRHLHIEKRRNLSLYDHRDVDNRRAPEAPARPAQQGHRPLEKSNATAEPSQFYARSTTGIVVEQNGHVNDLVRERK